MKPALITVVFCLQLVSCSGGTSQETNRPGNQQGPRVGGRCEGCEAIYESPIPFEKLPHTDTLPGFNGQGEKILIKGVVYQKDGKRPAAGVVIYVYHTDRNGVYPTRGDEKGWDRRHGYIRGWMKTNEKGEYRFYTLRPASYPNSNNPQHIHMTVKEPDKNEYWIDDIHFTDDPLVTPQMIRNDRKTGGSGFTRLENKNGISEGSRDIILGLNVEGYD